MCRLELKAPKATLLLIVRGELLLDTPEITLTSALIMSTGGFHTRDLDTFPSFF